MKLFSNIKAFTMAEMLVSLTIIGVIAALTLPAVKMNSEKRANAELLKKAIAKLDSVTEMAQTESKFQPLKCFIWLNDDERTNSCRAEAKYDEEGRKSWEHVNCEDGEHPNGYFDDCDEFYQYIVGNLKTFKTCDTNAIKEGCAPEYKQGVDDVWKAKNPQDDQSDSEYDVALHNAITGCSQFTLVNLKEKSAFVTSDGMIFYPYVKEFGETPMFLIDVNGKRGPNKFGHDLFTLQLMGSLTRTPTWKSSWCEYVSEGGHTVSEILKGDY